MSAPIPGLSKVPRPAALLVVFVAAVVGFFVYDLTASDDYKKA
jgi:hypothetical protein